MKQKQHKQAKKCDIIQLHTDEEHYFPDTLTPISEPTGYCLTMIWPLGAIANELLV